MGTPLRILIVEDSPSDAELIVIALRRGGIDPTWQRAETAEELEAALVTGPWDAILSDYSMPTFGAEAALKIVRSRDAVVPFLGVSGTMGEDLAVALMRDGANDYVLKHNLARLAPALDREIGEAENRRARKRADEATRASEIRYRRLFEAAQDGILIVDPDSRQILDANPFLTNLLGYRHQEFLGKELWEIGLFQDVEANKAAFEKLQKQGYLRNEYHPLVTMDGRRIDVEFVSNIYDAGDTRVVQCNIRDIGEQRRADKALKKSESEQRQLAEAMPQIIWVTRPDGYHEFYNQQWYDYTGLTFGETEGERWNAVFHPDDQPLAWERWRHSLATGKPYQIEYRCRRHDGVYRWFLGRALPQRDESGTIVRWIGTCTDIHNFKQTREERDRLLDRLTLQIERMPLAFVQFDSDFRIIDWNPEAERIFGYSKSEALGMVPFDLIDPKFRDGASELLERIRQGDLHSDSVNENLTKDGRTINCEWFNTPLKSEGGEFIGVSCLVQDISSRIQSEAALHLRDRAIRAATQGLLITEPGETENPIIFVSPGYERMTGYLLEEVLGRDCRFLQGKDTDPAAIDIMRTAIQREESCTVELLNYRKDGIPFWNQVSIAPVRDSSGQLTHFVGVQTDVTARRKLEEQFRQAQKMEAFGQLAGGVAHDFNNLLTVILGYSELLLQGMRKDDPSRGLLAEIHKAGSRSAALTRQLLAFSRQQVLAPRVLNLNDVVSDTDKMLRRVIGEDVRLTTSLSTKLWAVRVDAGQMEQVLLNLAVNARDAMPTGGHLTIETENVELDESYVQIHRDAKAGPQVRLNVSDTGTGMLPEVQARVFEPFFTTKDVGKGTGLGLATVFGIIKQSGGHIEVESEVGVGTTFKIYLPRVEAAIEGSGSGSRVLVPPRGTETLLLVEDELAVRALTRHILTGCGYTVLEAADGNEANRVASRHEGLIHLLLTDVVMPGAGGSIVAESVRERFPEVRVLFMSGYTDDAVIRHGVYRDQVHFLQKPFTPFSLAVKVREVLDAPKSDQPTSFH